MPYLVRVGLYKHNVSNTTCKGYFVGRSGKRVTVLYGPIDIVKRKYYWAGPNIPVKKVYRCTTEQEAGEVARSMVKAQLRPGEESGGYTRLPSNRRILSYRFNPKRWM